MTPWSDDPKRFISYYETQAGGLPGYHGAPVMYGKGVGSVFARLFRFVTPFVKKGFAIAKPHLKTAAKGIATDVISRTVNKLSQEGSGGLMLMSRRARKRPPGTRVSGKKRQRIADKKPFDRRTRMRRSSPDIF